MLVEYAFNIIASVLQIGPIVRPESSFDVVCYKNAAQFYMEKCFPAESAFSPEASLRLLYCVKVMHSFGLVHRDIKPANIAHSPTLGELVLIDFGIALAIQEQPGHTTLTYK